jgi:hypothetical protein
MLPAGCADDSCEPVHHFRGSSSVARLLRRRPGRSTAQRSAFPWSNEPRQSAPCVRLCGACYRSAWTDPDQARVCRLLSRRRRGDHGHRQTVKLIPAWTKTTLLVCGGGPSAGMSDRSEGGVGRTLLR